MNIEDLYTIYTSSNAVCTDTRKLKHNDLYFALKGIHFDGNAFAQKALDLGASYCVIDNPELAQQHAQFIYVDDALSTLQKLANFHRKQLTCPIIALTGSNGKTTTKELIASVLSTKYTINATQGNLNNHIGVPLTLLSFTKDIDFGIVEMGANHQKEIAFLSRIAEPDYGVITNFGKAHLEGFGGVEGVIKGKSELYDFLTQNQKTVFINTDDNIQRKLKDRYDKVITFGTAPSNMCCVTLKSANPFVHIGYKNTTITSQLIGDYNFNNIAIAVAIGQYFEVSKKQITTGIERYISENNRSQIIHKNSNQIILDAYNANPTSMLAALENFKRLDAQHKYLFLGDMFELGDTATEEHQKIVTYIETHFSNAKMYLTGKHFYQTKTKRAIQCNTFEHLSSRLTDITPTNASILIKGSRGMALERILDYI